MKCDKCNNDASIEIVINSENESKLLKLCFDCYSKILEENLKKNTSEENYTFFSDVLKDLLSVIIEKDEKKSKKACPKCGTSYEIVCKEGLVGCEKCYDSFFEEIKGAFSFIHGANSHLGRYPKRYEKIIDMLEKIKVTRKELDEAIELEAYEKASIKKGCLDNLNKELETLIGEENE